MFGGRKKRQVLPEVDPIPVDIQMYHVGNINENDPMSGKFVHGKRNPERGEGPPRPVFPFGRWDWGLPDLGFVSGTPRCETSSQRCGRQSPVDSWYSDCVCPWVWTGKSSKCPVGDELSATVAKANVLYLKNQLQFPEVDGAFEVVRNFTASVRDSPVQMADIEALLSGYASLLSQELNSSVATLLKAYLDKLSPDFKQSLLDVVKQILGWSLNLMVKMK